LSDSVSSHGTSTDSEGWLFSDAESDAQDVETFSRFRLQHAPSDELRAARVDATAAAQVRHFDECMTAAHAWVLVDSMWLLKRQQQVANTVQLAAAFVRDTTPDGESLDDMGVRAAMDMCLDSSSAVSQQVVPLLVGANMHQFRASVIRLLELCAARLQAAPEDSGARTAARSPDLSSIKRMLGPLRALHCRHTGQAAAASLRDAVLHKHPAPLAFFASSFGADMPRGPATVQEQARSLVSLPPVILPGGSSVEESTSGLLHNLYLLPPEALCGLAAALGAHEFNIHFGTVKATPNRADKRQDEMFGARVQRKRQTEAFRLAALEAQVGSLRNAVQDK